MADNTPNDPTEAEFEGLKEAAIYIGGCLNLPARTWITPADFRKALIPECDDWIERHGEPALGKPYTATMKAKFYSIMEDALKPVENPPLDDMKDLLEDGKVVVFDLNFGLPTKHPSYDKAVARMKKRREEKP